MISSGAPVPDTDVYDGKGAAPLPVFFQGRTLLMFFAADCERCRHVLALVARWRTAGVNVVGISQETIEDTADFLKESRFSIPVVIDDRPYQASRAFEIEQVPALALVDDDFIEWTSDGCPDADLAEVQVRLGIAKPLSTDSPAVARSSRHIH